MKNLIKKFGYNALIEECERQGWRIPTIEEVKASDIEYNFVWVQAETKVHDDRLHTAYGVKANKVQLVNKSFMLNVAVIVEPQVCRRCKHIYGDYGCMKYGFNIKNTTGLSVDEFGCTPGFIRKGTL